jgi:hypothetical protein
MNGRCSCGEVVYRLRAEPLIVHACHCTWCQRESGSAFALNGMIETRCIEIITGAPVARDLPSSSGRGQRVYACGRCGVALWTHYRGAGPAFAYVKMGTLDDTSAVAPDVHIFTSTRQTWLALPDDVPVFEEFYRRSEVWRPEAYARFQAERAREA